MSDAMTWSTEFCVDITTLDEQHEELFNIANELCAMGEAAAEKVRDSFNYLLAYADYHLGMEEKVMRQVEYPQSAAHIEAHTQFREHIARLKQAFDEGNTAAAGEGAFFLICWLQEHIRVVDRHFADFMREAMGADSASEVLEKAYYQVSCAHA